jgi:hypothetical protein
MRRGLDLTAKPTFMPQGIVLTVVMMMILASNP